MSSSPDNFERLLRLFALKRYEQPPPRYFAEFHRRVVTRLEREGGLRTGPWWRQWAVSWELSPVAACSMGVVACTVLLVGLSYFFWVEPSAPENPVAGNSALPPVATSLTPVGGGVHSAIGRPELVLGGSSNAILNSESSALPFNRSAFQVTPAKYDYIPRNN